MFNDWHCTLQSECHKYHIMAEWMQFFGDNFIDCYWECHWCSPCVTRVQSSWDCFRYLCDCMNNEVNPSLTYKRDYLDTGATLSKGHLQGMHSVSQCDQYIKNISSPHKSNAMETWASSHCWPCSCFTIPGDNKARLFWHHGYCHLKTKPSSVCFKAELHLHSNNIVYHQLLILVSNTSIILICSGPHPNHAKAPALLQQAVAADLFSIVLATFVRLLLNAVLIILCIILTISWTVSSSFQLVIRSDLFFINSVPSVPGYNVS